MSSTPVPDSACELARAGRWREAWALAEPQWPRLARATELETLRWLQDLCLDLGLEVRARLLRRRMAHLHPRAPVVRAYAVFDLLARRRLADAWYAARADADPPEDVGDHVRWLRARARLRSALLDHAGAMELLATARSVDPASPDVGREEAWALLAADRVDDALATLRAALLAAPTDTGLLLTDCRVRHIAAQPGLGDHFATTRLRLQSPSLDGLHASHCHENGDLEAARTIWTSLLAEPMHERRARIAWTFDLMRAHRELGDDRAALACARRAGRIGQESARRLDEHLRQPPSTKPTRRVLPVPFVRQDHLTCSPATMASLLRTFGVDADQREIAAAITYDGTGSHREMSWALDRGLVARFFQFDAATARRLIDLGLPFALATRFEDGGHRQAVVGYDTVLRTFVLRDPTDNFRREADEAWLEMLAHRGGDCALLLPASHPAVSAIPPLPAEAETMASLQARIDLEARRTGAFDRAVEELLLTATGSVRREILARAYHEREDRAGSLSLWRDAYARHPDDPYFQYHLALELHQQGCWHELRTVLERWHASNRSPYLARELADQWRHDASRRDDAERLLRGALRRLSTDARTWHRLAGVVWDQGRRVEAAALYDVAATLAPHDEWLAGAAFGAARQLGRTAQGLARLHARVGQFGAKSAGPAITLAEALESEHRSAEAVGVLEAALSLHDTPEVRRRLFDLLLQHARSDEAGRLLQDRTRLPPATHASCRHALALATGDRAGARAALHDAVAAAPANAELQRQWLAHLLVENGREHALAEANRLVAQQPDHAKLLITIARFCEQVEDHARAEMLYRRLVHEHPHESWLRGRLARFLLARGRVDEAAPLLSALQIAQPNVQAVWIDVADLEHARGNLEAARAAAQRALDLSPDSTWALRHLVEWAETPEVAATHLRTVMSRIAEHPLPPDDSMLTAVVELADGVPIGDVVAWLERLERNFPAAAAPLIARYAHARQRDPASALGIARELMEREPWRTEHRLRVAHCLRSANRRAEERATLDDLLRMDPACGQAWCDLGQSFLEEGNATQAFAAFERGLAHAPGHAVLHGMLADAAWSLGQHERALTSAARALELDRGYSWAARARVAWLGELGRAEDALALAEELARENPRWPTAHDLHARALDGAGRHDDAVAALRRAVALAPRSGAARLRLVDRLTVLRRWEDARAVLAEGRALLGDQPELAEREAVLERTAGRVVEAREMLRASLERHPAHTDGWVRWLTWCEEEGRHEDILAAHREPPAALRDSAVLQGFAADVLRARGQLLDAEQALERALALDASYDWARDTLCSLALDRGQPARVLELQPDHATPERLLTHRAVLVAQAAARTGRFDVARAAFERLLRDSTLHGLAIGGVDELLRKRRGAAHWRELEEFLKREGDNAAVACNHLRVLAARRDMPSFWRRLDRMAATIRRDLGDHALATLLGDARDSGPLHGLGAWVARHVTDPPPDARTAGQWLLVLTRDRPGQRQAIRLFGKRWRELSLEGWMLANLANALFARGRLDDAEAVSRHALANVPHDHSVWWHRRYLAEIEYRAGRFAAASALCDIPVRQYPGVRLRLHQIDLAARLRQLPWRERAWSLRAALPETFRRFDDAVRNGEDAVDGLKVWWLLRACPGPTTLLLAAGARTRRLLRRLLRC